MTTKPRPHRPHTHVSVTGALHARLQAYAQQHNVTINSIVDHVVRPALGLSPSPMRAPKR